MSAALLGLEGLAVGALADSGVRLVGAYGNAFQSAVILSVAMVLTLHNAAADAFICLTMIHSFHLNLYFEGQSLFSIAKGLSRFRSLCIRAFLSKLSMPCFPWLMDCKKWKNFIFWPIRLPRYHKRRAPKGTPFALKIYFLKSELIQPIP